jgi:DNA polymerase III subunit delta
MSVAAQRALRLAIESGRFDPVYYVHGDDEFRKSDAVKRIVDAALDASTRDFNHDAFRGSDIDAGRLSASLTSFPVLAARRVVLVRDVNLLKKAARAELIRYLKKPASETVLVLVVQPGEKTDTEIESLSTSVAFPPLSPDKLPSWITSHARDKGVELTEGCAELIAEAVGGDLLHAVGELDKLASYANGRAIQAADVEAILGVRRGETLGDLLDAVASRDAQRAIRLVAPVLAQPKTTGVQIVMFLATQTVAMAWARAARNSGLPAQRLEQEFINLMRAGGGFPGRPWGEAAKCWARNLPKWNAQDLARGVRSIGAADVALKDTRVSSDEAVLTSLVLSLCVTSSKAEAA